MKYSHDFPEKKAAGGLDALSDTSSKLGFEIVDIAGFLDEIEQESHGQLGALGDLQVGAARIIDGNTGIVQTVEAVSAATQETLDRVQNSFAFVRESGQQSQQVAEWVQDLTARTQSVQETVEAMRKDNAQIASIAAQVNILAINAKIEAGRAGAAGRGFAVVAEAINDLSRKTERTATGIKENIDTLFEWIQQLREETAAVSKSAGKVLEQAQDTDSSLTEIERNVQNTGDGTRRVLDEAQAVKQATDNFGPALQRIATSVETSATGIHKAHERIENLINSSERLVQGTVALGGQSADGRFIEYVTGTARRIGALFDEALANGQIAQHALFDRSYRQVPGTDPQQVVTGFTALTDRLLPPLLEAALEFDPRVAFCAAVDVNGYLPTHNKKFSHPQSKDPVWNTANCRHRRIFDDRVGLKAGRNTEPFLLQVYRRDMGGGNFAMMKDLSAPIHVQGRHWGGLRMGLSLG